MALEEVGAALRWLEVELRSCLLLRAPEGEPMVREAELP